MNSACCSLGRACRLVAVLATCAGLWSCGQTVAPLTLLDVGYAPDLPGADLAAKDLPADEQGADLAVLDTVPALEVVEAGGADAPEPGTDAIDVAEPIDVPVADVNPDAQDPVDVAQCATDTDCPAAQQPCHLALCSQGACALQNAADATPCDDGDACTLDDTCQQGACEAGAPKDCADTNGCTTDTCSAGTCQHADNTLPCSDSNVCTLGDACSGGVCLPGATTDCSDDNVCTTDSCDGVLGCQNVDADGATCNDGNACTAGDACSGGACVVLTVVDCSDDNPCTDNACAPASGCVALANSATCTDNDACTLGDVCAQSLCASGAAPDCDDKNPCTSDACAAGTGCTHIANPAASCSDDNACTLGDACQDGACLPGELTACSDGNPCTTDDCLVLSGCENLALPAPCNDGNACTIGDICKNGGCAHTFALLCDDGNPCTTDSCEPSSGCVFAPNTLPCTDYNNCTTGDVCSGGVCKPSAPSVCDDSNPCTTESCDPVSGCTKVNNTAPCTDGSVCTVGDVCAAGACQPGSALVCNDSNPCTTDTCESGSGCTFANNTLPCNDGSLCTYKDVCGDGLCLPGAQTACDDGNACTTDACHPKTGCAHGANAVACSDGSACTAGDGCKEGLCVAGAAIVCDDGNPCTTDSCTAAQGCVFVHSSELCSDGSLCTEGDTCSGGACVPGAAKVCDDGKLCTNDGCDPSSGCTVLANAVACEDGSACTIGDRCKDGGCKPGADLACDDGNLCTADSCNQASGCVFALSSAACEDGNVCTVGDLCQGGVCTPGAAKVCDDAKPCTTDACDPKLGCVTSDNTLPCSDGSACTQGDACQGGSCQPGATIGCEDGNPCTDDGCVAIGGCTHSWNTKPCDDQNGCTTGDVCKLGLCTPTGNSPCNDQNPCTTESCDPATGACSAVFNAAPCTDNNACTVGDVCASGACKAGSSLVCSDGNVCTDDSCAAQTGCVFLPNAATCSDNNLCTIGDGCTGGWCAPGAPKPCADGNPCTDDACIPASGCAHGANSAACSDGNACTVGDTCALGLCGGVTITCDDANVCTDDSCDPAKGCVFTHNSAPCNDGNGCTGGDTCTAGSCLGQIGCDVHALCMPGALAVSCVCKPFYSGDGFACADTNECLAQNGGCGSASFFACTNQIGAPRLCADINECLSGNGGCGDPAVFSCTNNVGAAPTCTNIAGSCLVPSDCPGVDSECRARACTNNQCTLSYAAAGKVLTAQIAGDCQRDVCTANGLVVAEADNADVPADDGNVCTAEGCEGGAPVHPFQPAATACSNGVGGTECDGKGACVACIADNECGVDTVCVQHSCLGGACALAFAPTGTDTGAQTAGDCHKAICDGHGGAASEVDLADLPAASANPCLAVSCQDGVPGHPPFAAGTVCGQAKTCDGTGTCVQCLQASDCGQNSECQTWSCNAGQCAVQNAADGTVLQAQTAHDCKQAECNGQGAEKSVAWTSDKPADEGNPCTDEVCVGSALEHTPTGAGASCSQGTGKMCDGKGACVECLASSDCGSDTVCMLRTCTAGACGISDVAKGTLAGTQVPNDCQQVQCNGLGGTETVANNNDVPLDDGKSCTAETCVAGVPTHPDLAVNTACSPAGYKCDGNGACMQCLAASDCGVDTACLLHTCSAGSCGTTDVAKGTPAGTQTAHDCQKVQCNGTGATESVADNSDVPVDDGLQCTGETCVAGVASHPAVADSTACSQNGGTVCKSGACVAAAPSSVIVVRVGTGSGTLSNAATAVFLEERSITTGGLIGTVHALPTATAGSNGILTLSGTATSEGGLSRSADGRHVTLAGFESAVGTASVAGSTTNRIVALMDSAGTIDTTTRLTTLSGTDVRGVTADGTDIWVAAASGGIYYLVAGAQGGEKQVVNLPSSARWPGIFDGQLYLSSGSSPYIGINKSATTLPKGTAAAAVLLTGMSVSPGSPYGFAFVDHDPAKAPNLDTLYIADDRTGAGLGGIQKWTISGTTWSLVATYAPTPPSTTIGCRGLAAWMVGTKVTLVATTTDGKLVTATDDFTTTPTFTTLATATTNTTYRGVALAPQ